MHRLALTTALLFLPALADAQVGTRTATRYYAFAGCDYRYADIFGPGPRACGSATAVVTDYRTGPSFLTFAFTLTPVTGYVARSPTAVGFSPYGYINPDDVDGATFAPCVGVVCRGGSYVVGDFLFQPIRVVAGYVPTGAGIGGYYLPDAVRTGTSVAPFNPAGSVAGDFALTPAPEPSTLALTIGGVAVLGWAVWRRRMA